MFFRNQLAEAMEVSMRQKRVRNCERCHVELRMTEFAYCRDCWDEILYGGRKNDLE